MILIIMGVSGCGKSTVGAKLATALPAVLLEGDKYHPSANVEKMASGTPLTDEDRWPWLCAICTAMEAWHAKGNDVVVTCSALRQAYRDLLADGRPHVRFVYLKGSEELIRHRLEGRLGHFMPSTLLRSQFKVLEEPRDAITVDIAPPADEIVAEIIAALSK